VPQAGHDGGKVVGHTELSVSHLVNVASTSGVTILNKMAKTSIKKVSVTLVNTTDHATRKSVTTS
jgi:hypothetical protein